jgi:hypothetical protein
LPACDFCYDGIRRFCKLEPDKDELVKAFRLENLFPCNHKAYCDWADWYNAWKDNMLIYYHKNDEVDYE